MSLLALSAVGVFGAPKKVGETKNLLINVSILSLEINVPFKGKVTLVGPVVFKIKLPNPFISKFLPKVIVLPGLLIPVPPLSPANIPLNLVAESAITALKALNAYGTAQI